MIKKLFLSLFLIFALATSCFAQTLTTSTLVKTIDKQTYKTVLGESNDEVIIGDSKSIDFKPQITFSKWKDPKTGIPENSLTIKAPDIFTSTTPSLISDKLEIGDSKTGFYFNPDPDNAENFKFGLILYEKPTTNTWSFQLEGWEEFDFFYQDTLENDYTNFYIGKMTLQEYLIKNQRPENIIGSYAIYHKWKINHKIGETDYKCGKFGHIYRPKLIDADNRFLCWVDLHIESGTYSLTVPQSILDTAKYPLRFNDEYGTTSQGGSFNYAGQGDSSAHQLSAVSPAGTNIANYIHVYGKVNTTAGNFVMAIYSQVSSKPSAKVAGNTDAVAITTTAAWRTNANDLDYTLTAATQYWVGIGSVAPSDPGVYYDGGSNTEYQDYTAVLPATWTRFTDEVNTNRNWSIHISYTAGGGAARRIIMVQ